MRDINKILNKNPLITKEFISKLYLDDFLSLSEIQAILNINQREIRFLFSKFNIKIRTAKESANSPNKIRKTKETLIKNYGVENPSKSKLVQSKKRENWVSKYNGVHWNATEEILYKRKETNIERYGSEHIFQTTTFKEKSSKTCEEKYGKKHHKIGDNRSFYSTLSDAEKLIRNKKISEKLKQNWLELTEIEKLEILTRLNSVEDKGNKRISKVEKRFAEILQKEGIDFKQQKWINKFSYDLRLNNSKVIIEVEGDYWHCNPKKYSADFIHPTRKIKAQDIWFYDELKRINAEKYGYKVIYVWEFEIKAGLDVISRLNSTDNTTT